MFEPIWKASGRPALATDNTPAIVELLAQSRARCEDSYRLDRSRKAGPNLLTPGELKTVVEPVELLTRVARPEMEALLAKLAPANYVVVLSDASGVAVDFVASGQPDKKLWRMGVCAGATWGEPHVGTNGIGTCIMTRSPIIVHQRNHFLLKYAELTCTAAPLFDAQGRVIASLDASSVANLPQEIQWLVLDLVVQTARRIERLYFLERHRDDTILTVDHGAGTLKPEPVFMLAVGEDGCVIDVQGNTDDGSDASALDSYRRRNLTNLLETVWQSPGVPASATHVEHKAVVNIEGDGPCFTVLRAPAQNVTRHRAAILPRSSPPQHPQPRRSARAKPVLTLERLAGGDPVLRGHVAKISRFAKYRLPFLILGETGTGKEEFARAIHAQSPRAAGPFVAIDCSSIPENLIESELFGYESGTFTGARREGRRGRILDANGGTLLLDEIGDMPLALQTRLLRVLAQNEVVPLGGHAAIKTDFNLICATHQDLKSLTAQGRFRQDLYFRIAGFRIELPPLRARRDKEEIILGALELESAAAGLDEPPALAPAARDLLIAHTWPGNMRELRLALRFAIASAESATISAVHLPTDISEPGLPDSSAGASPRHTSEALEECLARNDWCVSRTARQLRVSRQTVHRWMAARNLRRPGS